MKYLYNTLKFLLPLSIVLSIALTSCNESSSPEYNGSFSANVTDIEGTPISGALVEALTLSNTLLDSTRTNAEGLFTFKNLPSDFSQVDLRISAKDFPVYKENLKKLKEMAGASKKIPLKLQNDTCCGRVELTITNHDEQPLNNVQVKMKMRDALVASGRTDSNGTVVFENICPGSYWVRLAKDYYQVVEEDFSLEECDTVRLTLRMTRTEEPDSCCHGKIILYVKDSSNNNGLQNVGVWLKKNGVVVKDGKTGDNGRIVFENICPGEYRVYLSKDFYLEQNFEINMDCDDTLETTRYMSGICCNGIVRVNVKTEGGENINGATVKLWKNGKMLRSLTTEGGYVVFRELCEGSYGFSTLKSGFQGIEFQTNVECDDSLVFDKTLNTKDTCCTARLKVRIKSRTNSTFINNAQVILYRGDYIIDTTYSSGEGWAVFENLCAPFNYAVVVTKDGFGRREVAFQFEECTTKQETIWMEEE